MPIFIEASVSVFLMLSRPGRARQVGITNSAKSACALPTQVVAEMAINQLISMA
jgi:predicted oxidoreductase